MDEPEQKHSLSESNSSDPPLEPPNTVFDPANQIDAAVQESLASKARRDVFLVIRIAQAEKDAIKATAKAAGIPLSDLVRYALTRVIPSDAAKASDRWVAELARHRASTAKTTEATEESDPENDPQPTEDGETQA